MDQRTGRHGIEHRTVLLALSKFAGIHFETGVDTSRIVGERQSLGYRDKIDWNGNRFQELRIAIGQCDFHRNHEDKDCK